jgi:hypothetical protein
MSYRRFAFFSLACAMILAVGLEAQTRPAAKSITVYKTPT